ncbi:MAG: DEAD/DEAH box helicase [Deltaproteobacteria bacterium]|nr:DEAD/DEAH box helicase [Deltaproteobacteria bacterium]
MTSFKQLKLIDPLLRAVARENYQEPTPIQAQAIPLLLAGRDILGCAQTGTGKTAAFALPMLQMLTQSNAARGKPTIRALVLSPTRELAAQIEESFVAYARFLKLRHLVIFGGVKQNSQVTALRRGIHILVATPGRLLDLIGQGYIHLGQVQFFVLDEADRMLDMGFIHDIRKVLKLLPAKRQNLLFSATLPPDITRLAGSFLSNPARVEVSPPTSTVDQIEQRVLFVDRRDKPKLLISLLSHPSMARVLIFTRTKHGADRLVKKLNKSKIPAGAIHGNKSQNARRRALAGFHSGEITILVATDLASRGIDVENISHVFNYDLPHEPEVYIHRIGRTGRAGLSGVAISFCDESETADLRSIERLIGNEIPVDTGHAWHEPKAMIVTSATAKARPKPRPQRRSKPGRLQTRTRPRPKSKPASKPARKTRKPANESAKKAASNRSRRRWRHSTKNQSNK